MRGKIGQRFGIGNQDRDYSPVDGEEVDFEEVEDPNTTRDEDRRGFFSRIMKYKTVGLGWGVLITIFVVWILWFFHEFFISILTNPYFIGGSIILTYSGGLVLLGLTRGIGKIGKVDELVTFTPSDKSRLRRFRGELEQGMTNEYFVPYRGTRLFGLKWEPYKRGDFGFQSNKDQPVRILVNDLAKKRQVEEKTVVSILAPNIKYNVAGGGEADFVPERPDMADKDTVDQQREEINNLEGESERLERRVDTLQEDYRDAVEELKQRRRDVREELRDIYEEAHQSGQSQYNPPVQPQPQQQNLESIENEMKGNE